MPIPVISSDIRDVDALRAAFHDYPITAVIHCAGLKKVARVRSRGRSATTTSTSAVRWRWRR